MIERKFIAQRMKELQIQEFIEHNLKNVGHSMTKMQKTPVGEKIVIYASRPGLIVGRKGENIKQLTKTLKIICVSGVCRFGGRSIRKLGSLGGLGFFGCQIPQIP